MIRLEKWVTEKDADGNNTETVTDKVNVFAEVTRLSGGRASANGITHLDNFYQFVIRFTPKYNPTGNWRIIYGGKLFTVHSVERVNERRFYWNFKASTDDIY